MSTITLTGNVSQANGEVLAMIIYDSNNNPVWKSQPTSDFADNVDLLPGAYEMDLMGYTQGAFNFNVTGCTTINPPVPASYQQRIADVFQFTV